MGQPFVGEIRMFAGNFPPVGWLFCDGATIPIAENETLFNLIGTIYGGDGQQTFAVPNLQSRIPIHAGQGPGLSQNYTLGEAAGQEQVTLITTQLPQHNHQVLATTQGPVNLPTNAYLSTPDSAPAGTNIYGTDLPLASLAPTTVQPVGGNQPHENMQPFLVISFIISLYGIYPQQA